MSTVTEQLAQQLALVAKQIEDHRTAIWLLERRQFELRMQLKGAGFTPPDPAPVQQVLA